MPREEVKYVLPLWTVPELIVLTEAVYLCYTDEDQPGSQVKVDWTKVAQNLREKAFREDAGTFYTAQVCKLRFIQLLRESNVKNINSSNLTKMTRNVNQQLRARRQHELTNIVKQYRDRITQFESETESIRIGRVDSHLLNFINQNRPPNTPEFCTKGGAEDKKQRSLLEQQKRLLKQYEELQKKAKAPETLFEKLESDRQRKHSGADLSSSSTPASSHVRTFSGTANGTQQSSSSSLIQPAKPKVTKMEVEETSSSGRQWLTSGIDWLPSGWSYSSNPSGRIFRSQKGTTYATEEAAKAAIASEVGSSDPTLAPSADTPSGNIDKGKKQTLSSSSSKPEVSQESQAPSKQESNQASQPAETRQPTTTNVGQGEQVSTGDEAKVTNQKVDETKPIDAKDTPEPASTPKPPLATDTKPQTSGDIPDSEKEGKESAEPPATQTQLEPTPLPAKESKSTEIPHEGSVSRKRGLEESDASQNTPKRGRTESSSGVDTESKLKGTSDSPSVSEDRSSRKAGERYRGVYPTKSNKWQAKICRNGTLEHLGTFFTAAEAARAWDKRAVQLGKTPLNFPEEFGGDANAEQADANGKQEGDIEMETKDADDEEDGVEDEKENSDGSFEEKLEQIWNLIEKSELSDKILEPPEDGDENPEEAGGYASVRDRIQSHEFETLSSFYEAHGAAIKLALTSSTQKDAAQALDQFVLNTVKEMFPEMEKGTFVLQAQPDAPRRRGRKKGSKPRKSRYNKDDDNASESGSVKRKRNTRTTRRGRKSDTETPRRGRPKKNRS